jgi:hypothetical protein
MGKAARPLGSTPPKCAHATKHARLHSAREPVITTVYAISVAFTLGPMNT